MKVSPYFVEENSPLTERARLRQRLLLRRSQIDILGDQPHRFLDQLSAWKVTHIQEKMQCLIRPAITYSRDNLLSPTHLTSEQKKSKHRLRVPPHCSDSFGEIGE